MTENRDVRTPGEMGDEKTTLLGFANYLRDAMIRKVEDLSEEDARRVLVPSGTSLLGLVKHLTFVELAWFVWSFAGEEVEGSSNDQELNQSDTIESIIAGYQEANARANTVIEACADLDQKAAQALREEPMTMRWMLVHLIEETARHAGHADIIREQIDGVIGR